MKKTIVIGAGISGLATAACLAAKGMEVTILEKNSRPGGRARVFEKDGYRFDMGPTWYWMPDVFERFFSRFGKSASDYYTLRRLDPGYRVFFEKDDWTDVPANMEQLVALFEQIETGSGKHLREFLARAERHYRIGIGNLVYKPALHLSEYLDMELLRNLWDLRVFTSLESELKRRFRHPKLRQLLGFPVIFVGATAKEIPAFYSLMNHADLTLGTWYPEGGMYDVVEALVKLNKELGTYIEYNTEVNHIVCEGKRTLGVETTAGFFASDYIVSSADYQHTDSQLLPAGLANYSDRYWQTRKMAPSALLYYLGYEGQSQQLLHHNLLFDTDFARHSREIYYQPQWPADPALYISAATKTDTTCAPAEHENIIVLIPVAPGLEDTDEIRGHYRRYVTQKLSDFAGLPESALRFEASYGYRQFRSDYYSYRGNAYGLANVLMQTAFLKPRLVHRNLKNLVYCGQLTVPGPGVPPALISGTLAAEFILKNT